MANNMTPAMEEMTIARIALLLKQPFFGTLAMKLHLIECDDNLSEKMKTAAVDGRRLWYNAEFIMSMDKEQRMFLVAHEVLHCVFEHLRRRVDRDPKVWNSAADYVINATLVEVGMKMPDIGLYEDQYLNWTSEDVYDEMIKNGDSGGETMDVHPGDPGYPGDDEDGNEGLSEEDAQKLADEWKDALIQAAGAAAGNVPAGLARLIQEITEPRMDWRQMLQMHLQACVRTDYSWMKPNKRTFGQGITMPSMVLDDMVKICIAVDCSGSVSEDMLKDFLTEVKGVMDAFSGYEIHIACFDTVVYNYMFITDESDLAEYIATMKGGGGTDFMCWWDWAADQDWIGDVHKCLFFTDGYPWGQWGTDDLVDTLWIVHGSREEAPFGVTVFYEDHVDK